MNNWNKFPAVLPTCAEGTLMQVRTELSPIEPIEATFHVERFGCHFRDTKFYDKIHDVTEWKISPDETPAVETRLYATIQERKEFGTSQIEIECPFCKTREWAYLWSLAGSGKKCSGCGAVHHYLGSITVRKVKPVPDDRKRRK